MNTLYFYSDEDRYDLRVGAGLTPRLKIGQTIKEVAYDRIEEQDGTSQPVPLVEKAPALSVEFTDKEFHRFLISRGYEESRHDKKREWFMITAEEATTLAKEFSETGGVIAVEHRPTLDVRPYQAEFVEQYCSTTGDFLLFAKCRAGKSVMGMLAATKSDYKSLLVVSLRTSAGNSWLADTQAFREFYEWDVIDLHDDDALERIKDSQSRGHRTLMVGTVQSVDDKFPLKRQLKRLFPNGIDALYLDECHIGGLSPMVKALKESIDFGRVLEISGTAFKAAWFYDKENTFVWDYVKEQQAGLGMPRMDLTLVKYDGSGLKDTYADDPDRLANIFTTIDGEWQDAAAPRSFFTRFFTYGRQAHKSKQLFRDSDHIVMSLPSVAACNLAVKLFEELNMPWAPIAITSDTGNNQETIKDHVKSHPRTICFTRFANVVGVTVKEWDTVVHGSKTESAEFYIQFSFRGGSTRRDSWRVVDFAPEQSINSIIEMVQATANAAETEEAGSLVKEYLDFADVHEFDDGFEKMNFDDIMQMACEDPESSVELLNRRATLAGSYGEYSEGLARLFSEATRIKGVKVVKGKVNENDTEDKGNMKVEGRKEATPNEQREMMRAIKGALKAVPTVVAVHALGDPISTVFQLLASPYLADVTNVDRTGFEAAIEAGWISERELSSIVAHSSLVIGQLAN